VLERLVENFPDDVQIVYRHFPLNQIHDNAQKSAEASEAAGAQGMFWEYHDALFERQRDWSPLEPAAANQFFVDLAGELGLDEERFADELEGDVYAAYVSALEQEAIALGLPGTPAALVNGEIVAGQALPMNYDVWESFVQNTIAVQTLESKQYEAAPPMTLEEGKDYKARVTMENGDEFVIQLLPDSAPQTVNSFIFLANEGWFDGVTFHRVLPGFVAQTGDPTGTGMGDPGYALPDEIDPNLSHDSAGVVAMANSGPNTSGSQFYITFGPTTQLDGGYTIFGRVIEGMEAVEQITPRDPQTNPNAPAGDLIRSVRIEVSDAS
jgi:cyclophilin family peptidyl-prolyl cis-trans isomerase